MQFWIKIELSECGRGERPLQEDLTSSVVLVIPAAIYGHCPATSGLTDRNKPLTIPTNPEMMYNLIYPYQFFEVSIINTPNLAIVNQLMEFSC